MNAIRILLSLALVLALPTVAAAGLYKWVDSDGKVVFSDKPPPAKEAAPGSVEGYTPLTVKQAIEQERELAAARRAKARREAALAEELERAKSGTDTPSLEPGEDTFTCAQARQRLEIQSRGYENMFAPNPDGTYSRLDADAVDGLKASWQAIADRVCAKEAAAAGSTESTGTGG